MSVEVRRQTAAYALLRAVKQAQIVDEAPREYQECRIPGLAWHPGDNIVQIGPRSELDGLFESPQEDDYDPAAPDPSELE
ncbi:MAG TPA: hypothetical protein VH599_07330 [Ktedonobacterales bacterium]